MYFEWLVFFGILGFFFFLYGNQKGSLAFAFTGAIIVLMLGAILNLQGISNDNARIIDLNSTTKDVTFYSYQQKDVFTYGIGMIFVILGIAGLLLSVAKVSNMRQKEYNG